MKKVIIILAVLCFSMGHVFATKHTIGMAGLTFNPATTTARVGDTIEFILAGIHTATQVEQSTWDSNMNMPIEGGFNFSAGTSIYVLTQSDVGTIYFVCIPHAHDGMKATIEVQDILGIENPIKTVPEAKIFPNLVKQGKDISIELTYVVSAKVTISNLNGKVVLSKEFVDSGLKIPADFWQGVYVLQIMYNGKTVTKKIIVE